MMTEINLPCATIVVNPAVSVAQGGDAEASECFDLSDETHRQLRRYQNRVWKESTALFPSREADRITDRSVRNVITRAAEEAGVRPYRIEGGVVSRPKSHRIRSGTRLPFG